jgi:VWFA-related protein
MSDHTAHGLRAGTKTTKLTKITNNYFVLVFFVVFVIFVSARGPWAVAATAQQTAPPTQAQQRPVFRGGTHFVRVDAYPTSKDGRILEGLTPEDFEIFEDGKPQAIESFDYIRFDTFTPEVERRAMSSRQEGFDLAADPRYRVFVIFADVAASTSAGPFAAINDLDRIQNPLVGFLDRVLGPQDLYGFLTSRNSVKDLVLSQKTDVTRAQILDLWRASLVDRDDADEIDRCGCGTGPVSRDLEACRAMIETVKARHRAEASYATLHDLVSQLGAIRQERKNVVLVSNRLTRAGPNRDLIQLYGQVVPQAGILNGRPAIDNTDTRAGGASATFCSAEYQRLANVDFDTLYRDLLDEARRDNVSFYVITPGGLQAPVGLAATRKVQRETDDLKSLASETGGIAVVNTNDLTGGMKQIADDLQAYYVLGYYTTNTRFDGRIRRITVKSKGQTIRARREYRAPTEAEIAAMSSRPAAPAARVDAGPAAVIGEPVAYRVSRAQPPEKVSLLEFVRADRLRVEWPVLAPLDRREARLLDSAGKPLPIDLPVSEAPERKTVVVELPLAPFGRGVYAIELTAGAGGKTEQRRLTFMMK